MKRLIVLMMAVSIFLGCSNPNEEILQTLKSTDAQMVVDRLKDGRVLEAMVLQSGCFLSVSVRDVHTEGEKNIIDAVVECETCLKRKHEFPLRAIKGKSGGMILEYKSWYPTFERDYFEMIRNQRMK